MDKGWAEKRDVDFLNDLKRENLAELDKREDPAQKDILCKCGHTIGKHYMGDRAMPCGVCSCSWCTAPRAEVIRRERVRLGSPELHPHPDFRRH